MTKVYQASRYTIISLLLLTFGCSDFNQVACVDDRNSNSDISTEFCVDPIARDGENNHLFNPFENGATDVTFHSPAQSPGSCGGASYDFGTTDTSTMRVTVNVLDNSKSILPKLDLVEGSTVKVAYQPRHWTAATISIEDHLGAVFQVSGLISGDSGNWLQVTTGNQLENFCSSCGTYGVYELKFKSKDSNVSVSLKPGQTGKVTYKGREFVVANIESVRSIDIHCTDAYGTTTWSAWRVPK